MKKQIRTKKRNTKGKLIFKLGNKIFFKMAQIPNTKNASRLDIAVVGFRPFFGPVLR